MSWNWTLAHCWPSSGEIIQDAKSPKLLTGGSTPRRCCSEWSGFSIGGLGAADDSARRCRSRPGLRRPADIPVQLALVGQISLSFVDLIQVQCY